MKKLLITLLIVASLSTLVACSATSSETSQEALLKGRASSIVISSGDSTVRYGKGSYEYVNETTVKYTRDTGGVYYIPAYNIVYIEAAY